MKKFWIKLLLFLAAVVLVIAVVVATSSVHSKDAVERYKDQLRAAGEKMDLKDIIPSHVEAEKNGADLLVQAFPAMSSKEMLDTNPPAAMKMVAPGKAMIGSQQAGIITESEPRGTNSWDDLDRELQTKGPALELLRQASEREEINFELDYDQGFTLLLPHLVKLKQASQLLSASALANLHRGDSAAAATNLDTVLNILNQWKDEPLLISQLVRIAMTQITFTTQWEFLQNSNITDPQLAMLQRDWAKLQLVRPMETSLLMERVWGTRTIEQLRTSNSPSSYINSWKGPSYSGGGSGDWIDTFRDMGETMKRRVSDNLWRVSWSYNDELAILQGDQVLIDTVREAETNGYFKNALADRDRKLAALGLNRSGTNWLRNHLDDDLEMLGSETIQNLALSLNRLFNAETTRVMTMTAVALKRYQLRHQTYPGSLNALVPEILPEVPRDPVDGKPLRYQVLPDGTFLLYSIGSDNVDNGGDPNAAPGSKGFQWQKSRDWVWPRPATQQEIDYFRANPPK